MRKKDDIHASYTIRQNLQDELMKFADQRADYQSSSEGSVKHILNELAKQQQDKNHDGKMNI